MTAETRPTTLSDVARLAAVSPMTVSRVVTGRGVVHAATRRCVEEAMRQLRYTPNIAERTLAGGRSVVAPLLAGMGAARSGTTGGRGGSSPRRPPGRAAPRTGCSAA